MRIHGEDILKVRRATDLADLIGSHLKLRPVGNRKIGMCPFHDQETRSLVVNAELGRYTCLECGERGDAIAFVQHVDGLEYNSAVRFLASKAGITLRYLDE
jgi:DNA primase